MTSSIQFKRGTNDKVSVYTPLVGEPVWDTTNNQLRTGDGSTVGGVLVGTVPEYNTTSYASTITIEFNQPEYTSIALTGDLTFTDTLYKAAPKFKEIKLIGDSVDRNLSFPSTWYWSTEIPTIVAATSSSLLKLQCYGTAETDIVASYSGYLIQSTTQSIATSVRNPNSYWRMDEISGIRYDQTGLRNLGGNASYVNGVIGNAARVGLYDALIHPLTTSISTPYHSASADFTVCFMMKASLTSSTCDVIRKDNEWVFYLNTDGTISFIMNDCNATSGISVNWNEKFYFVVGRRNSTTGYTGISVTPISGSIPIAFYEVPNKAQVLGTGVVYVGYEVFSTGRECAVDELGIWQVALTDEELRYIFYTFKAGNHLL